MAASDHHDVASTVRALRVTDFLGHDFWSRCELDALGVDAAAPMRLHLDVLDACERSYEQELLAVRKAVAAPILGWPPRSDAALTAGQNTSGTTDGSPTGQPALVRAAPELHAAAADEALSVSGGQSSEGSEPEWVPGSLMDDGDDDDGDDV